MSAFVSEVFDDGERFYLWADSQAELLQALQAAGVRRDCREWFDVTPCGKPWQYVVIGGRWMGLLRSRLLKQGARVVEGEYGLDDWVQNASVARAMEKATGSLFSGDAPGERRKL